MVWSMVKVCICLWPDLSWLNLSCSNLKWCYLPVCCPSGTFGPQCKECLGGRRRPCRGNGHCQVSFTHQFIGPFIIPSIHPFTDPFIRSFIHSFICSFIHLFIHSSVNSFIHPFIHLLIHSSIHSSVNSFIHPFIHSSIHSCGEFMWSHFRSSIQRCSEHSPNNEEQFQVLAGGGLSSCVLILSEI